MTAILFTAFGACTLAPYIFFRCKRKLVPGILFKIATSVFFLITTCAATLAWPAEVFAQYKFLFFGIIIGQVLGLLGDFWLDMKDMYPQHKEIYMFSGFSSFLICHLFFIAGLLRTYGAPLRTLLIIAGAGLVLTSIVLATEKLMKLDYGKYKAIAVAYTAVFGMSLAASLCSWYFGGRGLQPLVMNVGLVVFLLSDLVLSGTFFGEGKDRPVDYILNYLFYYGAQFTIALSLLAIAS